MSQDLNRSLTQLRRAYEAGVIDEETYRAAAAALGRAPLAGSEPGEAAGGDVGERGVYVGGSAGVVITGDHNILVVTEEVAGRYWAQFASLQSAATNLSQATARYLRHLVERYRYLDFRGLGLVERLSFRVPLLDMVVPLRARIDLPEGDGRPHQAGEVEHTVSEPLLLLELLQAHNGLVLLGDPGSGKTTFLKYLALQLALGQGEVLGLGQRLPLVLSLSAYANALADRDIPLHRFLATFYRSIGLDLPLEAMIERALGEGGALLLLDGLDEVKDVALRHLLVQRVLDFFAFQRQNGNKFVFTSRMVGYHEVGFVAEGLVECTVAEFGATEIEQFVTRWTRLAERAVGGDTEAAAAAAAREKEELLAVLKHSPSIRRLAANPLLLTILVLMKRQGVVLPERRVELYDRYIRVLLKQWGMVRSLNRPLGYERDVVEIMRVLAPLALWMYETSPGLALVPREAMLRQLTNLYRLRGAASPERAAQQFLSDLLTEAGLLVERGRGVYSFIHLSFQEYLAAVAVAQLGQSDVRPIVDRLCRHADDDNWHEVISLTVGYVGLLQQRDEAAATILLALMEEAGERPGQTVVLAGEALRDAWPGGVTPAGHTTIMAALQATMTAGERIRPACRVAAGRVLAQLGDLRPEVTEVDEMTFCFVPPGPFWMGEEGEAHLNNSLAAGYWIGRFPVTNAQFDHFVAAGGYREAAFWREAAAVERWQDGLTQDWQSRGWRARPHDYGPPFNLGNHPVVGVTWYEVLAFTRWLARRWQGSGLLPAGWKVRLPSEAEWEKAARGGLDIPTAPRIVPVAELPAQDVDAISLQPNPHPQRPAPWGGEPTPEVANYRETGIDMTSTVGCFPGGAAPYGCEEMGGNVWEWTRSHYRPYPYVPEDGREETDVRLYHQLTLRGGAYWVEAAGISCAARARRSPNDRNSNYGFRVVVQQG